MNQLVNQEAPGWVHRGAGFLAAFAALLLLLFSASARAVETGVVANDVIGANASQAFSQIEESGAQWVRIFVPKDQFQLGPGVYAENKMSALQSAMAHLNSKGTKVIFAVTDTTPPRDADSQTAYADYVAVLAARFPTVYAIEIWNEEDAELWWPSPDATTYTALLKSSYTAIKNVNANVKVVIGGLTGNNYAFLEQIYANAGGPFTDGTAIHTDTACLTKGPNQIGDLINGRPGPTDFSSYDEVRKVMNANGDSAKPIYMTEFGWSATTALCDQGAKIGGKGGVTEAEQADFLSQAFRCIDTDNETRSENIDVAIWFSLVDVGEADTPFNRFGLIRTSGAHKPSFNAFKAYAKNHDYEGQTCNDIDRGGPSIELLSPSEGDLFVGELRISVKATDTHSTVKRIQINADGQKIRSFSGRESTLEGTIDWQGSKQLALGQHVISAFALDSHGTQGPTTSVQVKKVTAAQLAAVKTSHKFVVKKLGSGKVRVSVEVKAPKVPSRILGKVQVVFQKYDSKKKKWVTAHKYNKNASKPFTITRILAKGPKWRVRAIYKGVKPFKASKSKFVAIAARR